MRSNYKRLGKYIQEVNIKNSDLAVETLLGVSIQKILIPSIANTIGSDMSKYKVVVKNQFAYGPVTSRNGDKISVAILKEYDKAIISQSYYVFEVIDEKELLPDYLMMWFSRPEFDRYARFMSHGSTRETFDWDEMCEVELPIPPIEEQKAIVAEYQTVTDRIQLNEKINTKLEETAQALYRHWFVDFEFPNEDGKPYKTSGGKMEYNEELEKEVPEGWEVLNWGNISTLEYGKGLSNYRFSGGRIPVFGTNGQVGLTDKPLVGSSGIIVGRKGIYRGIHYSPLPFYVIDTAFYLKSKIYFSQKWAYYSLLELDINRMDSGSAIPSTSRPDFYSRKVIFPTKALMVDFENISENLFILKYRRENEMFLLKNFQFLLLSKMAGSNSSSKKSKKKAFAT